LSFSPREPDTVLRQFRHRFSFAAASSVQLVMSAIFLLLAINDSKHLLVLVQILPITTHTTLALFLLTSSTPSYLATSEPITSRQVLTFCQTCQQLISQSRQPQCKSKPLPHHWRISGLHRSVVQGCRICKAVWKHRMITPSDFRGFMMFWKPTTSFTRFNSDSLILVRSEECRNDQKNTCRFDVISSRKCKEPHWSHIDDTLFSTHIVIWNR
jgi:hypothetical protein